MLLEVEARRSVLLRLTGDDAWPTVAGVGQMPLVGAAGFAWVFRAAFHVKRVLADELDIASLVARTGLWADLVFLPLLISCQTVKYIASHKSPGLS